MSIPLVFLLMLFVCLFDCLFLKALNILIYFNDTCGVLRVAFLSHVNNIKNELVFHEMSFIYQILHITHSVKGPLFVTITTVNQWNSWPRDAVQSASLEVLG